MMRSILDFDAKPSPLSEVRKSILSVEDLKVVTPYGGALLDGVSFHVAAGETLAIVGESGAGKSMTALSVMRLLPQDFAKPTHGKIMFEGTDILSLNKKQMRQLRGSRISMIFQDPLTALNPVLTVGQQIMEVLYAHGKVSSSVAVSTAIELLEKVGIPAPETRINEYPHRLSGGMRQRVMIATALACKPKLLIADEPTTALDVTIQAQILDLLASLQRELQVGLILITHDLGVVKRVADRVAVMYSGRIVEEGYVKDVLSNPAHPYTAGLLAARPSGSFIETKHRLHEIPGTVPSPESRPKGCAFQNRCPKVASDCAKVAPTLNTVSPARAVACHHSLWS